MVHHKPERRISRFEGNCRKSVPPRRRALRQRSSNLVALMLPRGNAYLYRQTGSVPNAGGEVEYVKLSYEQAQTLQNEISESSLNRDQIWSRAKQLAGGTTNTASVSKSAANQGVGYLRGQKMPVAAEASVEIEGRGGLELEGGEPVGEIGGGAKGIVVRGIGILSVFLTLKDACEAAGINGTKYHEMNAPYYFTDGQGSVFTVQTPGLISQIWRNPQRSYVAGPKMGQTEDITSEQVEEYKQQAEKKWGKYIPGGIFTNPRFIPARIVQVYQSLIHQREV